MGVRFSCELPCDVLFKLDDSYWGNNRSWDCSLCICDMDDTICDMDDKLFAIWMTICDMDDKDLRYGRQFAIWMTILDTTSVGEGWATLWHRGC